MSAISIIVAIMIFALLVEAIIQTIKMVWDEKARKISFSVVASIIVSIGLAFGLNLSIFAVLPLTSIPPPDWLAYLVTGILCSRGSNFIHDLWVKINATATQS
jgi:uncharacterized BrkB/YihY/UPF0761 family membrane protein